MGKKCPKGLQQEAENIEKNDSNGVYQKPFTSRCKHLLVGGFVNHH